jgi:predicted alpha/beta hydrolase family esterase
VAHPVLILHGLSGSGPGHWQSWLAARMRALGHEVSFPDLPDPDSPRLEGWLEALGRLRSGDEVVVCHSLACLLWLHHRADGGPPAARVILAAPPCEDAGVPEIEPFFPVPLDPALADGALLVCSDDDPYCPGGAAQRFGEPLGVEVELVSGGGHLNPDAGLGPWPEMEQWVLQGAKKGIDT